MRLARLLAALATTGLASSLVAQKREDAEGPRGQDEDAKPVMEIPSHKYFQESVFSAHYDPRFAKKALNESAQQEAVKVLLQTYLATAADLGIQTWLMHGTLLGWWWNKRVLPWDSDADVQISEGSMFYLAAYYNMTVFYFKYPRIPKGRSFQLEVNPNYLYRDQADTLNVIDARWIDMENGLFIDITAARYNLTHPEGEGVLSCKDGHEYRDTYIFPLLDTVFEGVPAKIPFKYKDLLRAEYGEKALTRTEFNGHQFVDNLMEWIPKEDL